MKLSAVGAARLPIDEHIEPAPAAKRIRRIELLGQVGRLLEGDLSERLKTISDRVDSALGGSQQLDL